ncbi:MAG: hypothetical protein IJ424_06470 [Oscillospiraceae bacterium]|nr:hypothetical protein [Oscillospiraceae bacterium]
MIKRIICVMLALVLLVGCGAQSSPANGTLASDHNIPYEQIVTEDVTDTPLPEAGAPLITEPDFDLPTYGQSELEEIDFNVQYCLEMYQAEEGEVSGYAQAAAFREGYIGEGYVSGVSLPDSELRITVAAVSDQHYNITVCAASDKLLTGIMYVDGSAFGSFSLSGSGSFEAVKFENIYLSEGEHYITFGKLTAEADFDYVILEDSKSVIDFAYNAGGVLSNSKASDSARALYEYLCQSYGKATLSAQQCSQGTNNEIYEVLRYTGKYPAIRFGELMDYATGADSGDVEYAIDYAENGGIVGYVWHWVKGGSVYAEKSDFDVKKAVNAHDIARMSESKLNELYESGGVSDEAMSLLADIDEIAAELLRLKELDIPVLFRPLPEASGGWYWWGEDKDAYLWLYRLIYMRLTDYWHLDNLIFVWNGQDKDWYVGDEWCDIISLDIYDFSEQAWNSSSRVNLLHTFAEISLTKPVVISECNVLPSPVNIVTDRAYFGYACVWSGEYVVDAQGGFGGDMTEAEWVVFYNSSAVITRDEVNFE